MVSEADSYAGMWIQHEPDYRVIVRFTERGEETLLPYLADTPLAGLVEVRGASITLASLVEEQQALGETLQSLGIAHESYLDEVENRVVLLVLDPAELDATLAAANVALPTFVEANQVESFSQDEADIYGGLEASVQCVQAGWYSYPTTGFNLIKQGTIYASTTGHACRGAGGSVNMTVNGLVYPFVGKAYSESGSYDFQWHSRPGGSSAKPWVKDGYDAPYPSYRVINGVKPRLEQRVGEWVCKWGRTTQLTCGTILSIYVSVQENGFPPSPATYILVAGGLVDLSQERDSGAPWFSYDTAYGIHKGAPGGDEENSNDAVYMAADFVGHYPYLFEIHTNNLNYTHLPDLRNNVAGDGWVSSIYLRNDSTVSRNVQILYYNANGSLRLNETVTIGSNQRSWLPVNQNNRIAAGNRGSARVGDARNISALVAQYHASPEAWAVYTGISYPDAEVHVPLLYRNTSWGLFSQVFVRNNGDNSTNITFDFKAAAGNDHTHTINNVAPNATVALSLTGLSQLGNNFHGSARIFNSANNLLAVTSTVYRSDQSSMSEVSNTAGLANVVYAPLIQNYNYGWISGAAFQNAGWASTGIQIDYYNSWGGSPCYWSSNPSVSPYASFVTPSPPGGVCSQVASAIVKRTNVTTGFLEGIVNQVLPSTGNSADYRAVANPSTFVSIPFWHNGLDGWTSGMVIQNVNIQSVNVTVTYYWSTQGVHSSEQFSLAPRQIGILANSPGALSGSATVTASLPVAVVTTHSRNASDGVMSSTAIHK
jgi:streptogrisin C